MTEQIETGDPSTSGVFELNRLLEGLDESEWSVMLALMVSAPQGSPPALVFRIAASANASDALERLLDRGLAERDGRLVRLAGELGQTLMDMTEDARETWRDFKLRHAVYTQALAAEAIASAGRVIQEDLYQDLLLAAERLTTDVPPQDPAPPAQLNLLLILCGALSHHPRGDREEALTRVTAGYRVVLARLSREAAPSEWAAVQNQLAAALMKQARHIGEAALQQAMKALKDALTAISKERQPDLWAAVQNNLGDALMQLYDQQVLASGAVPEDVLERAIRAYRAALEVTTREKQGALWGWTQANLGNALLRLTAGARVENLWQALDAYRAAMTVFTREATPTEWAIVQINLGAALRASASLEVPFKDKASQLREAIAAFEEALSVLKREDHPSLWAAAQANLGDAHLQLPDGLGDAHLRRAIEAFRAALSILTPERSPEDWASVQLNLGSALRGLSTGDRAENLRQAVDACSNAIAILNAGRGSTSAIPVSSERFQEAHRRAQRALNETRADLAALAPREPLPASTDSAEDPIA